MNPITMKLVESYAAYQARKYWTIPYLDKDDYAQAAFLRLIRYGALEETTKAYVFRHCKLAALDILPYRKLGGMAKQKRTWAYYEKSLIEGWEEEMEGWTGEDLAPAYEAKEILERAYRGLNKRNQFIMRALGQGLSQKEIGLKLGLLEGRVSQLVKEIREEVKKVWE